MKIKVLALSGLICCIQFGQPLFADGYPNPYINPPSYPTSPYYSNTSPTAPEAPSNNSSYGDTHYVTPYYRNDGTYVRGHEAGNPGSGVHCHLNAYGISECN